MECAHRNGRPHCVCDREINDDYRAAEYEMESAVTQLLLWTMAFIPSSY